MPLTDFLYQLFLSFHNLIRWAVMVTALIALFLAYRGWFGKREWTSTDERVGLIFLSVFDSEVLLGLILYFFFSSAGAFTLQNFGTALANPYNFFFGIEHVLLMAAALGLAHAGRILARRTSQAAVRHMRLALCDSAALILVLLAIPWEGLNYGRPLFRLFGITF